MGWSSLECTLAVTGIPHGRPQAAWFVSCHGDLSVVDLADVPTDVIVTVLRSALAG